MILLLGTDAAGKDHVARILVDMIHECGGEAHKRRGFFSAGYSRTKDSTQKSLLHYAAERAFLVLFRPLCFMIPIVLFFLVRLDLWLFRRPEGKLIIVGYHGLRALAFYLAQAKEEDGKSAIPSYIRRVFAKVRGQMGLKAIVLDVDEVIRKRRIDARSEKGKEDFFDRYMLNHPQQSERIERSLVSVSQVLLGAARLTNNDLQESEIRERLVDILYQPQNKNGGR